MPRKGFTVGSLIRGSSTASVMTMEIAEEIVVQKKIVPDDKRVTISQNGNLFEMNSKAGQTLLEAALNAGQPIQYKCQKGTCGVCKVKVLSGGSILQPANKREQKKLESELDMGFRLACQALMV